MVNRITSEFNLMLKLSVRHGSSRLFLRRKADPAFSSFAQRVFTRDKHQCQFCGFVATTNMDVVNKDGNYLNNKMSNLVTACPFCSQCNFLDIVGEGGIGGGTLIYLPEFTQVELNAISHAIFSSIALGNELSDQCKDYYRALKARQKVVEQKLGEGLSTPALYGKMLLDSSQDVKKLHEEVCSKVRLLPNIKQYASQVCDWAHSAVESLADL